MNHNKLYQFQQEQLFTDLLLTLSDETTQLTINVHKNILASASVYFEKLLTQLSEKDKSQITIIVPNVHVAYDIILSFYGQKINMPNWKYILELCQCHDFFGLEINSQLLQDLEIPAEGFDLLLDVIELIGYNEDTIKIINKNLPDKYDLSFFPDELIKEMIKATNENYFIAGSSDHSIKIRKVPTGKLITHLDGPASGVCSVYFSQTSKQIVSGMEFGDIEIWDTKGELLKTLYGHTNTVCSVCRSFDNKHIASGSLDNSLKIWDSSTGKLIKTLKDTRIVNSVCYSYDNKRMISANGAGKITIWDVEDYTLINTVEIHKKCVNSVCFTHDSKKIISGSDDKNIKIWDIYTNELYELKGHTNCVNSVCCSLDDKLIISGSSDNTIKMWDAINYVLIRTLTGHTDFVTQVCISLDDKFIISTDCDKTIKIWNTSTGELINTIVEAPNVIHCIRCYSDHDKYYQKIINNLSYQQKIESKIFN